jgi:hypothetical protein
MNERLGGSIPHPRPEFCACSNTLFLRVSPLLIVPLARIQGQVKLCDSIITQDLTEREREQRVVLRYQKHCLKMIYQQR